MTPYDFGCYGSRVTYVCGAAALAVAKRLRERLVQAASRLLGAPEGQLEARDGVVAPRAGSAAERDGLQAMPYHVLAVAAKYSLRDDMSVHFTHQATTNPGAYTVQFAEVCVDCATGLVRVTDFLAVADVGQAINRLMVEGQYQGAVQMGIGYALCEEVRLDEAGRPAPGGFKNYHVVNAPDMPAVRVLLVEHEGDDGPYGAKSVGEIAVVPTAAAVVNAVNHALGTALADLPLTPEKITAALSGGAV